MTTKEEQIAIDVANRKAAEAEAGITRAPSVGADLGEVAMGKPAAKKPEEAKPVPAVILKKPKPERSMAQKMKAIALRAQGLNEFQIAYELGEK